MEWTRISAGGNLQTLLKDAAQYWKQTAETYLNVTGKRTLSAAFKNRVAEEDNDFWISSPLNITNETVPNCRLQKLKI